MKQDECIGFKREPPRLGTLNGLETALVACFLVSKEALNLNGFGLCFKLDSLSEIESQFQIISFELKHQRNGHRRVPIRTGVRLGGA